MINRSAETKSLRNALLACACSVVALVTAVTLVLAQAPDAPDGLAVEGPVESQETESPDAAARALERKRLELEAAKSKTKDLLDDVTDIDTEREKLNAQLLETAALIQKSEGQLTSIEGRLSELESQEKLVRGSLMQRHGQISQLLAALQRMGRNPPPVLITKREDALQMVRSAMLLSSAFPELKNQALSLSERLEDLVRVMTDIRSEGERLKSETARLNEARGKLAGLMEAKKLTLAERQAELASVKAATAEISKNVGDLSELIGKLDKTVNDRTGLGSYQEERRKVTLAEPVPAATASTSEPPVVTAATAPDPAPGNTTSAIPEADASLQADTKVAALTPPPRFKPQMFELAPSSAGMLSASPGRIKPAIPFAAAHAKLPLPAQGRRVLAFGERTQYGANSKGMVIETRSGAQVTAPCDGWIVYAGEFRSYGQLLIINAGDGYHVLLAGMSQIDAQPGQFVLAAEPIGTMSGAVKAGQSSVQTNAPVLYVEFRRDGRPIDPDPWWVAGQQKVQG